MTNKSWTPLIGYEGIYWVNANGQVKNAKGKILSVLKYCVVPSIELRKNGQRDIVSIEYLKIQGGKHE